MARMPTNPAAASLPTTPTAVFDVLEASAAAAATAACGPGPSGDDAEARGRAVEGVGAGVKEVRLRRYDGTLMTLPLPPPPNTDIDTAAWPSQDCPNPPSPSCPVRSIHQYRPQRPSVLAAASIGLDSKPRPHMAHVLSGPRPVTPPGRALRPSMALSASTMLAPPPPPPPQQAQLPGPYKAAHVAPDMLSPVDQNGSFCFDRVLKRGKVQRRIKHKGVWKHSWRPAYLVLRPNLLSIYKNQDETNLRASIALSDITAVARVKKGHLDHVFAVFSPAKNHHFQAASERDAADWVYQIRLEARPDDLDSLEPPEPAFGRERGVSMLSQGFDTTDLSADDSPEPPGSPVAPAWPVKGRSGTKTIAIKQPAGNPGPAPGSPLQDYGADGHNTTSASDFSDFHSGSLSVGHHDHLHDPERVIRQGWLQIMRSKTGGIKAWKSLWVVLRPKNVCFYKNEQEYSAVRVLSMNTIIDAAEIDALSRHKQFCFQIIAEDKTYRLCAASEEALAMWLGSLKSVLSKRHDMGIASHDDGEEPG
ncbi:hypothetical protein DV737_g645, partial [Chaetothyriales sp. CBS 132003]